MTYFFFVFLSIIELQITCMNKKKKTKRLLSDSIFFNLIAIAVIGVLLLILTLLFLNIYTRHGQNIIVPDLKGLQAEEAQQLLKSKGLSLQIVDSVYNAEAVPGSVIDQTPNPNNKVKEGKSIYISIYSYNPQQIQIPDLVDFSSRQAISLLNSIGFNDIEIVEVPAEYSGLVLSVEHKGRRVGANEPVPLGQHLRLIVGRSVDRDSLNSDFGENPNMNRNVVPELNKDGNTNNSSMDDSFF